MLPFNLHMMMTTHTEAHSQSAMANYEHFVSCLREYFCTWFYRSRNVVVLADLESSPIFLAPFENTYADVLAQLKKMGI
jgi:hypothetical protein